MNFKRASKADGFTGLQLDARSERQVFPLGTLREDFIRQMSLARDFPGITPRVITGGKAKLEVLQQAQQLTACLIAAWTEGVGNYAFFWYQRHAKANVNYFISPTYVHCSSSSGICATLSSTTFLVVTYLGASFRAS